ncbi:MAG: protein-L-isoaspartate(D-aspartate) O-methyltransferase [Thermoguttaceae bacterium]|nr:protein-L-isoaspartate(D-aspartate) O-methyltransferase [Thermoguttaceae bacterium]MDW8037890.1 protein-L-isoaspartate(D-aspartate) O-methyltransferase [Thermoguttaceae bacterium]
MAPEVTWGVLIGVLLGGVSWMLLGCMANREEGALTETQRLGPDTEPTDPFTTGAASTKTQLEVGEIKVPQLPGETLQQTLARQRMIDRDLRARGIQDRRVLEAMARVPRHRFVPEEQVPYAYDDRPLPIGHGQTISQPYIVALMTELAQPRPKSKALDIGTGSGYQAAILAELCKEVYSIEIIDALAQEAQERLEKLGYKNVVIRTGDGYEGWPEKAPFDLIIVAAAPDHVPKPLVEQLAPGGRLVIPVGRHWWSQELLVIEKQPDGTIREKSVASVAFVPMTGKAQQAQPEE